MKWKDQKLSFLVQAEMIYYLPLDQQKYLLLKSILDCKMVTKLFLKSFPPFPCLAFIRRIIIGTQDIGGFID